MNDTQTQNTEDAQDTGAAPARTQIVVAESGVEFITPNGKVLACLSALENGGVAFWLGDGKEPGGIYLSASEGFTLLSLRQPGGGSVVLAVGERGGSISVDNAEGQSAARVSADRFGGHFEAYAPTGSMVASLGASPGGGMVSVSNREGRPQAGLSVHPAGGFVSVLKASGEPGVILGCDQGDGTIVSFARNGAKVFAVPVWKYPELQAKPKPNP